MLYPKGRTVFYNPVQVQNRDLSVLMIELYARRSLKRLREKTMGKIRRRRTGELAKKEKVKVKDGSGSESGSGSVAEREAALEKEMVELEAKTDWKDLHGGIRVLDALAASGLRSLRYWNEIDGLRSVTINDLDEAAVDLARENIKFNGLEDHVIQAPTSNDTAFADNNITNKHTDPLLQRLQQTTLLLPPPGISVHTSDATHLMYNSRRPPTLHPTTTTLTHLLPQSPQYDVIDLDPYGSASPFLDAALQAVRGDGGMLCVTCTDMAALGGSHPETCYGRYGGSMPVCRGKYLQEMALRILLGDMARRAAVYGKVIRPVVCVGMAFYVRVFVEVWDDKAGVNKLSLNMGTVYQSVQCPSFHIVPHGQHPPSGNTNVVQNTRAPLVPQCEETGGQFKTAGPIWIGPLHDLDVVKDAIAELEPLANAASAGDTKTKTPVKQTHQTPSTTPSKTSILATHKNLHGLLTVLSEELPSSPLYYTLPDLCHTLGCTMPPMDKVRCAMANAGYRVSVYHKEPDAIKTDAPNHFVWDVMRAWCKDNPPKATGGRAGEVEIGKGRRAKRERRERRKRGHTEEKKGGGSGDAAADGGGAAAGTEGSDPVAPVGTGVVAAPQMTIAQKILAVEPRTEIDFSVPKGGLRDGGGKRNRAHRVARFPMNPEANWGPKPRASGYGSLHEESGKTAVAGVGTKKRKAEDGGEMKDDGGGDGK